MKSAYLLFIFATAIASASTRSLVPIRSIGDRQQFTRAAPYDASRWPAPTGAFRIYAVDTVNGRASIVDNLELAGLDSATRAQLSTPHQRLQRGVLVTDSAPVLVPQLVGVTRSDGTRRPDLRWRLYADQSLVESCPDECFDHAPSVHTITHFAKEGFYGAWGNAMTGNTMLVDPKTGRALPAPAGYFCAIKRRDA